MTKFKTLSDTFDTSVPNGYDKDDVKEFIRDIEDEIDYHQKECKCNKDECLQAIKEYIIKRKGERLT